MNGQIKELMLALSVGHSKAHTKKHNANVHCVNLAS